MSRVLVIGCGGVAQYRDEIIRLQKELEEKK